MEKSHNKIVTTPDRQPVELIRSSVNVLLNNEYITKILDSLPTIELIINEFRQILFCNRAYLELSHTDPKELVLGLRPGEMFGCAFHTMSDKGCGESVHCRYCSTVAAIRQSQAQKKIVTREAQLSVINNNQEVAVDFLVTAAPFQVSDMEFTIITLQDISNEKRRKVLERIFFHDVIDKMSSLQFAIEILERKNEVQDDENYIAIAKRLSNELISEILGQRVLLFAENKELSVEITSIESLDIIKNSVSQIKNHNVALSKTIKIAPTCEKFTIKTDYLLVNRVLINLMKNALEASQKNKTVTINCQATNNKAVFSVHNDGFMTEDVKNQIFHRSFSTKGKGRGIGTYSIKLLGEKYLKGKVWFNTEEITGTTFYFELPLEFESSHHLPTI